MWSKSIQRCESVSGDGKNREHWKQEGLIPNTRYGSSSRRRRVIFWQLHGAVKKKIATPPRGSFKFLCARFCRHRCRAASAPLRTLSMEPHKATSPYRRRGSSSGEGKNQGQRKYEGLKQQRHATAVRNFLTAPMKWGATARYYTSRTKTILPTRTSVPRSADSRTTWRPHDHRKETQTGHVSRSSVYPKPFCKAQWRGEEDKAVSRRGEKTASGTGQAWSSQNHRGQWRTGENGGNWLWDHLWSPNDPHG